MALAGGEGTASDGGLSRDDQAPSGDVELPSLPPLLYDQWRCPTSEVYGGYAGHVDLSFLLGARYSRQVILLAGWAALTLEALASYSSPAAVPQCAIPPPPIQPATTNLLEALLTYPKGRRPFVPVVQDDEDIDEVDLSVDRLTAEADWTLWKPWMPFIDPARAGGPSDSSSLAPIPTVVHGQKQPASSTVPLRSVQLAQEQYMCNGFPVGAIRLESSLPVLTNVHVPESATPRCRQMWDFAALCHLLIGVLAEPLALPDITAFELEDILRATGAEATDSQNAVLNHILHNLVFAEPLDEDEYYQPNFRDRIRKVVIEKLANITPTFPEDAAGSESEHCSDAQGGHSDGTSMEPSWAVTSTSAIVMQQAPSGFTCPFPVCSQSNSPMGLPKLVKHLNTGHLYQLEGAPQQAPGVVQKAVCDDALAAPALGQPSDPDPTQNGTCPEAPHLAIPSPLEPPKKSPFPVVHPSSSPASETVPDYAAPSGVSSDSVSNSHATPQSTCTDGTPDITSKPATEDHAVSLQCSASGKPSVPANTTKLTLPPRGTKITLGNAATLKLPTGKPGALTLRLPGKGDQAIPEEIKKLMKAEVAPVKSVDIHHVDLPVATEGILSSSPYMVPINSPLADILCFSDLPLQVKVTILLALAEERLEIMYGQGGDEAVPMDSLTLWRIGSKMSPDGRPWVFYYSGPSTGRIYVEAPPLPLGKDTVSVPEVPGSSPSERPDSPAIPAVPASANREDDSTCARTSPTLITGYFKPVNTPAAPTPPAPLPTGPRPKLRGKAVGKDSGIRTLEEMGLRRDVTEATPLAAASSSAAGLPKADVDSKSKADDNEGSLAVKLEGSPAETAVFVAGKRPRSLSPGPAHVGGACDDGDAPPSPVQTTMLAGRSRAEDAPAETTSTLAPKSEGEDALGQSGPAPSTKASRGGRGRSRGRGRGRWGPRVAKSEKQNGSSLNSKFDGTDEASKIDGTGTGSSVLPKRLRTDDEGDGMRTPVPSKSGRVSDSDQDTSSPMVTRRRSAAIAAGVDPDFHPPEPAESARKKIRRGSCTPEPVVSTDPKLVVELLEDMHCPVAPPEGAWVTLATTAGEQQQMIHDFWGSGCPSLVAVADWLTRRNCAKAQEAVEQRKAPAAARRNKRLAKQKDRHDKGDVSKKAKEAAEAAAKAPDTPSRTPLRAARNSAIVGGAEIQKYASIDEEVPCQICGHTGSEELILMCDICSRSFHMYCLTPKLNKVPEGDWFCQWCSRDHSTKIRAATKVDPDEKLHENHMTELKAILSQLMNADHENDHFTHPVDTTLLEGYLDVVEKPMDLLRVQRNLVDYAVYLKSNVIDFTRDVYTVYQNAMQFNKPGTALHTEARKMLGVVKGLLGSVESQSLKQMLGITTSMPSSLKASRASLDKFRRQREAAPCKICDVPGGVGSGGIARGMAWCDLCGRYLHNTCCGMDEDHEASLHGWLCPMCTKLHESNVSAGRVRAFEPGGIDSRLKQQMVSLISKLIEEDAHHLFLKPLDYFFPNYLKVVKVPMDLCLLLRNLRDYNKYNGPAGAASFRCDLARVFLGPISFHPHGHYMRLEAERMYNTLLGLLAALDAHTNISWLPQRLLASAETPPADFFLHDLWAMVGYVVWLQLTFPFMLQMGAGQYDEGLKTHLQAIQDKIKRADLKAAAYQGQRKVDLSTARGAVKADLNALIGQAAMQTMSRNGVMTPNRVQPLCRLVLEVRLLLTSLESKWGVAPEPGFNPAGILNLHSFPQEQRPTDADSDTPGQPQTRAQYKRIMHLFGRQGTHTTGPAEEVSSAFIRNPETSGGSRFVISVTIQDLFKAGLVKAGDEFTYKEHGARITKDGLLEYKTKTGAFCNYYGDTTKQGWKSVKDQKGNMLEAWAYRQRFLEDTSSAAGAGPSRPAAAREAPRSAHDDQKFAMFSTIPESSVRLMWTIPKHTETVTPKYRLSHQSVHDLAAPSSCVDVYRNHPAPPALSSQALTSASLPAVAKLTASPAEPYPTAPFAPHSARSTSVSPSPTVPHPIPSAPAPSPQVRQKGMLGLLGSSRRSSSRGVAATPDGPGQTSSNRTPMPK
eukprot:gene7584-16_t